MYQMISSCFKFQRKTHFKSHPVVINLFLDRFLHSGNFLPSLLWMRGIKYCISGQMNNESKQARGKRKRQFVCSLCNRFEVDWCQRIHGGRNSGRWFWNWKLSLRHIARFALSLLFCLLRWWRRWRQENPGFVLRVETNLRLPAIVGYAAIL